MRFLGLALAFNNYHEKRPGAASSPTPVNKESEVHS